MQEQVMKVLLWMLGVFAVYSVIYIVRWHWRRWRYGCSRCYYRRRYRDDHGNVREFCGASCGNNAGRVCGAWFYHDPEEDRDE